MKEHLKQLLKHLLYYLVFLVVTTTAVITYQDYKIQQEIEAVKKERKEQMKAKEKACIKEALWHEARGEGEYGVLAVASVIENRIKHPNYPSTYCAVIKQHKQFSYTLDKSKPTGERLEASIKASEQPMYTKVALTADNMVEGRFEPVLEHSVLWYAHKKVKNYWTKTKSVATKIGKHVFYKDKK